MYKNHEGYSDPTAAAALSNIIREEKRKKYRRSKDAKLRGARQCDHSSGGKGLPQGAEITEEKPDQSEATADAEGM